MSSESHLGTYAFFCPNCSTGWVAEVCVTKKDGAEHFYMSDPKEAPELTPSEKHVQVESIVANIKKRGTLFEYGGLSVASDGNWHFFFNDRALIGPLCGDKVKAAETPKKMPDDALICRVCIERVKHENDLRKAARRAKR